MTSPDASDGLRHLRFGHKLLLGIAITLSVVFTLVALFSQRGLYQFYRLRQERVKLEQDNVRLALENNRLARTIDRLQHDPELIQDLVRQELNFVRQNEIIFQFPPEKPAAVALPVAALGESHHQLKAEPPGKGKGKRTAEAASGIHRKKAKTQHE